MGSGRVSVRDTVCSRLRGGEEEYGEKRGERDGEDSVLYHTVCTVLEILSL